MELEGVNAGNHEIAAEVVGVMSQPPVSEGCLGRESIGISAIGTDKDQRKHGSYEI